MIVHRGYILFLLLLSHSLIIAESTLPIDLFIELGLRAPERNDLEETLYQGELSPEFMQGVATLNRYQVLSIFQKGFNLEHSRDPLGCIPTFKSAYQDGSKWKRVYNTGRYVFNPYARWNMADLVLRVQRFHQDQEKGLPEELKEELAIYEHNNKIANIRREEGFFAWYMTLSEDVFDNDGSHC